MMYWLSTNKMTVMVETDDKEIIKDSPPIVRKFIGQPINNLINWLKKQDGFQMKVCK